MKEAIIRSPTFSDRESLDTRECDTQKVELEIGKVIEQILSLYNAAGLDVRLVGSLARAASLQESVIPLLQIYIRDVDIVIINEHNPLVAEKILKQANTLIETCPYIPLVDEVYHHKIIFNGKSGYIRYKDIVIPINKSVFQVHEGVIGNTIVPTFTPEVLLHLISLSGAMRPKDFTSLLLFARKLKGKSRSVSETDLYPFHQLLRAMNARYPSDSLLGILRWYYLKMFSESTRNKISPITRFTKSIIKSMIGWTENK